jgi:hypothetical protein
MATSLPTWAYVWGRYLVVTALSLFFALEMLAAIVLLITIEHMSIGGADYPAAQIGPLLAPWAALVLPATIFAGGLGFALGTLLFRYATYVKLAIALGWFIWLVVLPGIVQGNPNVPEMSSVESRRCPALAPSSRILRRHTCSPLAGTHEKGTTMLGAGDEGRAIVEHWERLVRRYRHTEEDAERVPAFVNVVDQQLVGRNALLDLLVVAAEDVQRVGTILETVVEGALPDQLGDQL